MVKGIEWECLDWMALVHYKDQWQAFVTAVMNFIFHEMREISLNKWIFGFKEDKVTGQWRRLRVRSFMADILRQFYRGDKNSQWDGRGM